MNIYLLEQEPSIYNRYIRCIVIANSKEEAYKSTPHTYCNAIERGIEEIKITKIGTSDTDLNGLVLTEN